MVDWYNRDEWHASANFQFQHEHQCPDRGKVYQCVLMACRERPAEPCVPCQLRVESVLRRRARAAIAKAREWIRSSIGRPW